MANIKGFLLKYCVLFFEENIKYFSEAEPRKISHLIFFKENNTHISMKNPLIFVILLIGKYQK